MNSRGVSFPFELEAHQSILAQRTLQAQQQQAQQQLQAQQAQQLQQLHAQQLQAQQILAAAAAKLKANNLETNKLSSFSANPFTNDIPFNPYNTLGAEALKLIQQLQVQRLRERMNITDPNAFLQQYFLLEPTNNSQRLPFYANSPLLLNEINNSATRNASPSKLLPPFSLMERSSGLDPSKLANLWYFDVSFSPLYKKNVIHSLLLGNSSKSIMKHC